MDIVLVALLFGLILGVIFMIILFGESVQRLAFNCAAVSILCMAVARLAWSVIVATIGVNRAPLWLAGVIYVAVAIFLPLRYVIMFTKDFAEKNMEWKGREIKLAVTIWLVVTMAIQLSLVVAGFGLLPFAFR